MRDRDNGDGTITDCFTGLMWEKKDAAGGLHDIGLRHTWADALGSWLADLNSNTTSDPHTVGFAGHIDWRIPTIVELQTIIVTSHGSPTVGPIFNTGCTSGCTVTSCSCTAAFGYWSSSTIAFPFDSAWLVFFGNGVVGFADKDDVFHVRAVRGGR